MKKKYLCLLLCTMLSGTSLLFAACGEETAEVAYEELKVSMERPCMDSVSNSSEFMGTISTSDTVSVVPLVSGEITEKYFEEGDYVNEGDLLFTIDDTQAQQGIASAKAAYASAESGVKRSLGSGLDSQAINVTTSYKNAEISLDTAQYSLDELCSSIGDANSKISDLKDNRDSINNNINELSEKLKQVSQDPTMEAIANELKTQIAALQSQLASLEGSIASLESTRDSLESQVHVYQNTVKQAQVGMDMATLGVQETVTKVLDETLDTASTTLNQAQVAVNNASESLKYYSVQSPVSGTIDKINVEKFGMAQAGAPSYVITTDDTKKVTFYISEANINKVSVGMPFSAEYAGKEYTGTISEVGDSVDPQAGLFKVEATFAGNDCDIYAGSSVKVTIETTKVDNVLTLPLDAIYYESDKPYVYVNLNGVAKKTYVETGIYDDEKIEIKSGLDQNTEVITTWSSRLKDGEKVNGVN